MHHTTRSIPQHHAEILRRVIHPDEILQHRVMSEIKALPLFNTGGMADYGTVGYIEVDHNRCFALRLKWKCSHIVTQVGSFFFFFLITRPPPRSPLFPSTSLFQ